LGDPSFDRSGVGSVIAAIAAAVENALAPFGVRIAQVPINPQRLVELLGPHALGRMA
jgi:CO/xanthine dehydrogenase Mo-binding subunit